MRKSLLLAALTLTASACRQHPPEVVGKAVFKGYDCQRCHRVGYEGGSLGPDLTYVGFRKSAAFIDRWLTNPGGWKHDVLMPNFHIQPSLREPLVAYLASLQGQDYEGREPWRAEEFASDPLRQGAEIYKRVGCITCHGKDGVGGYPNNNVIGGKIPALQLVAEGFTKEELVKKISDGVRHPQKADPAAEDPLLYMPEWKVKLKPEEVAALADYLISLKPGGAKADEW